LKLLETSYPFLVDYIEDIYELIEEMQEEVEEEEGGKEEEKKKEKGKDKEEELEKESAKKKKPWSKEKFERCVKKVSKSMEERGVEPQPPAKTIEEAANAVCAAQMWKEIGIGPFAKLMLTDELNIKLGELAIKNSEAFNNIVKRLLIAEKRRKRKTMPFKTWSKERAKAYWHSFTGKGTPEEKFDKCLEKAKKMEEEGTIDSAGAFCQGLYMKTYGEPHRRSKKSSINQNNIKILNLKIEEKKRKDEENVIIPEGTQAWDKKNPFKIEKGKVAEIDLGNGYKAIRNFEESKIIVKNAQNQEVIVYADAFGEDEEKIKTFFKNLLQIVDEKEVKERELKAELEKMKYERKLEEKTKYCKLIIDKMIEKNLIEPKAEDISKLRKEGKTILDARAEAFALEIDRQLADLLKMDQNTLEAFSKSVDRIKKIAGIGNESKGLEKIENPPVLDNREENIDDWFNKLPWS
jgi:hypothetical protein